MAPVILLHPHVEDVVNLYLRSLDESAPGIVEAVYLTGSVALDDYRPGVSDIDFVAVSAEPLGKRERSALRRVHEGLSASRRRLSSTARI
jgi:predicted nucleotidyltransferase